MKAKQKIARNVAICLVAASIPSFLAVSGLQAKKFIDLEDEIRKMEQKQEALVEENKSLITGISVLSSADRIEAIASEQLGMKIAETNEIIRVEMGK